MPNSIPPKKQTLWQKIDGPLMMIVAVGAFCCLTYVVKDYSDASERARLGQAIIDARKDERAQCSSEKGTLLQSYQDRASIRDNAIKTLTDLTKTLSKQSDIIIKSINQTNVDRKAALEASQLAVQKAAQAADAAVRAAKASTDAAVTAKETQNKLDNAVLPTANTPKTKNWIAPGGH